MVDALGPETDFTLESNRKKVKEKQLKTIQNSEFYLLDLEFQTIKIQFFWAKSKKIQTFYNSKACFGVPESYTGTLQQKL